MVLFLMNGMRGVLGFDFANFYSSGHCVIRLRRFRKGLVLEASCNSWHQCNDIGCVFEEALGFNRSSRKAPMG